MPENSEKTVVKKASYSDEDLETFESELCHQNH